MENYLLNEVYQNEDIFEQIHDGCDMLGIDLFDVCCVYNELLLIYLAPIILCGLELSY